MKIKISNGTHIFLDYEVPDDPKLPEFDKHKSDLIDKLRDGYEQGSKSKPFDAEKAWQSLTGLARFYFRDRVKQTTTSPRDRAESLRNLAKTLRQARRLVDRTMHTDVGDDLNLFQAWWEVTGSEYTKVDGTFDPRYMEQKFKQVVKSLEVLEIAASYAADHVTPPKRGKPPVLSMDDFWNLAVVYRDSTSSVPGAGDGPFAKFVSEFLIATGRSDALAYDSLIEAIKGARQWALTRRKWGPSPFDEEA
jgi:hypothetical protein